MGNKFVTLFYPATNVHLIKDVGMIPYYMHKIYAYESYIVCYKNNETIYKNIGHNDFISILDDSYSYLNEITPGLKLQHIPYEGTIFSFQKSVLKFLWNESKRIDVLNLYHFTPESFICGILYKLRNWNGKLFLKLDAQPSDFSSLIRKKLNNRLFINLFFLILRTLFIRNIDVISNETHVGTKQINKIDKQLNKKSIYLPNGIDNLFLEKHSFRKISEKENIIVSISRFGTYQKNTELLLNVLSNVDLTNWCVYLIGPIEQSFSNDIDFFYSRFPDLKTKIIFKGNIKDRVEVYNILNNSKIFISTSRYEGFSLAMLEALYFYNFIITTEVGAANEVIKNESLGTICNSETAIIEALNKAMVNSNICEVTDERTAWISNYSWQKIVHNLYDALN